MPHDAFIRIACSRLESVQSRAEGRRIEAVEGRAYCRVEWNDFVAPERWLRDVSRDFETDVLWLVMQKQVDAFAFQHWLAGELKRRLTHGVSGEERTWEQVDGSPEPWEAAVLFSPRALEQRLKVLQVISIPNKGKAADDLKRIWAERRIEVGATEPLVNAGRVGPAIARYYELPGWAL